MRGIAIIMVVLYHLIYDLDNFAGYGIESTSGFWAIFADVSAFAFVFLVGLSLAIGYSRVSGVSNLRQSLFGKHLRRGSKIFGWGTLITLVFWGLDYGFVVFGILHLIGLSIILAYPFMKLRLANAFVGLSLIAVGSYLQIRDVAVDGVAGVLLAPFGIPPGNLFMPDYRPLLPWFGVVLLGLFFGKLLYEDRAAKGPSTEGPPLARPVSFLGGHTLLIYLVHQPVLIATLWAPGIVDLGF